MFKKHKGIVVLLMMIMLTILPGCWNYQEINNLAIVAGIAIDQNEQDQFILTLEIVNPESKGKEAQLVPVVLGVEGASLYDASRNLISRTSKRFFWSHAKVYIIGEELARKGILPVLEWAYRNDSIRNDINLLVSKGKTARDIFLQSESEINNTISFQLEETLHNQKNSGKFIQTPLWKYIQDLGAKGKCSTLPIIEDIEYNQKKIPQVYGTAVFSKDKMIGELTGDETRSLIWLQPIHVSGVFFKVDKKGSNADGVVYESRGKKVSTKAKLVDGKVQINVQIDTELGISELINSSPKYYEENVLFEMEKEAATYMEYKLGKLLEKVQREYKSDIFGFGLLVEQQLPQHWKKIKDHWSEIFPSLKVNIQVHVEITSSALMAKPLKVGD